MATAIWTRNAVQDIEEIVYYIAVCDRRPETAERNVREIKEKAEVYADQPTLGQSRPDLVDGLYCGRHKRWLIFYEPGLPPFSVPGVMRVWVG